MRVSVFSTIYRYFRNIVSAVRSLLGSVFTAVPYFFGSGDLRKEVTEEYPDPVSSRTEDDLPPRTRGLLFNDIDRCTGCGDCERICPVKCISLTVDPGPDVSKKWVSVFDVDFGKCMFCGLCTEICQPESLVHTKQYEGAVYRLDDLVTSFGRGSVTEEQRTKWRVMRESQELDG